MKRVRTLSVLVLLALAMIAPMTVMAPPTQETVEVWWLENAMRYHGDGTFDQSWSNDRIPSEDSNVFRVTGKAYHGDMALFYNYYPLVNFKSCPLVIANGNFAVWASYTSPSSSGLPILDKMRGKLTINEAEGTAYGSYVQYSYAFGTAEEVLEFYNAVETDEPGMWHIGTTYYTVHGKQ